MHLKHSFFGKIHPKFAWLTSLLVSTTPFVVGSCSPGHYSYAHLDIIQACQDQPSVPECIYTHRISLSSDEKRLLSVHDDKTARLWDLTTHTLIATFGNHTIVDAQYTPDGKSIVALATDRIQIWQASDQTLVAETSLCKPTLTASLGDYQTNFQFTADHHVLISVLILASNDACVTLIDLLSKVKQLDLAGQQNPILFANDTRLLTIDAATRVINVWDLTQGMTPPKLFSLGAEEHSLFLSPDEKIVVSLSQSSDENILNLERWSLETKTRLDTQPISSTLDLSPDKTRFFATPTSHDLSPSKIWDASLLFNTGMISELATLRGTHPASNPIFFPPHGRDAFAIFLETYSGSLWHVGWLFDSTSGVAIAGLLSVPHVTNLPNTPSTVVFSADGTQLYVGSGFDYNISIYDLTGL